MKKTRIFKNWNVTNSVLLCFTVICIGGLVANSQSEQQINIFQENEPNKPAEIKKEYKIAATAPVKSFLQEFYSDTKINSVIIGPIDQHNIDIKNTRTSAADFDEAMNEAGFVKLSYSGNATIIYVKPSAFPVASAGNYPKCSSRENWTAFSSFYKSLPSAAAAALILQEGVVVDAKTDEFKALNKALFEVLDIEESKENRLKVSVFPSYYSSFLEAPEGLNTGWWRWNEYALLTEVVEENKGNNAFSFPQSFEVPLEEGKLPTPVTLSGQIDLIEISSALNKSGKTVKVNPRVNLPNITIIGSASADLIIDALSRAAYIDLRSITKDVSYLTLPEKTLVRYGAPVLSSEESKLFTALFKSSAKARNIEVSPLTKGFFVEKLSEVNPDWQRTIMSEPPSIEYFDRFGADLKNYDAKSLIAAQNKWISAYSNHQFFTMPVIGILLEKQTKDTAGFGSWVTEEVYQSAITPFCS